jgi:chemotaxis protein methyltransferase CheR
VSEATRDPNADVELELLLGAIFEQYKYDFRGYSLTSLKRRLTSAMTHFGCETLTRLRERVRGEPTVFAELLQFLTVPVSDLFRDPSYFRAIRDKVIPYLRTYPSFKVWVAGCATGEEAYSMAIVLAEDNLLDRSLIYATDISPESLRIAERGVYAAERFTTFTANYQQAGGRASLANYYTARYASAVFARSLKKAIVFSDHSLATDSVFAEVQLVSCRNVLIYFERPLRERALGVLCESLCRKGFLGLGLKETLRHSTRAASFVELSPDDRIYQRI